MKDPVIAAQRVCEASHCASAPQAGIPTSGKPLRAGPGAEPEPGPAAPDHAQQSCEDGNNTMEVEPGGRGSLEVVCQLTGTLSLNWMLLLAFK